MLTANQLIYNLIELASSGSNPNEFRISEENVLFWINEVGGMLKAQEIAKKHDISDSWIQTLGCVELEQKDISDCCLVPIGCYGLKSIKQLPSAIEVDAILYYLSVTGLDGTTISKLNRYSQKYKKYSKYTGKNKGWFIKDNYLYIINDKVLKYVTVTGLFEDPSELSNFVDCSGESCWTMDSPYPISQKLVAQMNDIILKTKIIPFMQFKPDNTNDSSNQPKTEP